MVWQRPAGPARAAEVLDATTFGVLLVEADDAQTVSWLNPEATRLLGWTAETLIGRSLIDTVHPAHAGSCALWSTPGTGGVDEFRRPDGGAVRVQWSVAPLGADAGSAVPSAAAVDGTGGAARLPGRDGAVLSFATIGTFGDGPSPTDRVDLATARQLLSDLGWIADLTRSMSSTMDERESLLRMARLLTPRLCDVAVVDQVNDAGELERMGGSVAPGIDLDLGEILGWAEVQHVEGGDPITRETAGRFVPTLLGEDQLADPGVLGAPSRRLLAAVGARSLLIVPLTARNQVVGLAALIRRQPDAFSDADVALAEDVGHRIGLVLANARLFLQERRTSTELQHALLPTITNTGHVEAAARYLPARDRLKLGGDWYDLFPCADKDSAIAVVGDVAGHDLAAATTMAALRNLLRGIAVASSTAGPAQVLTDVDTAMEPLTIEGIATSMIVRVERSDGHWELTWSNAGHLPALLVHPQRPYVTTIGDVPDPLLGAGHTGERREHIVTARSGSILVMYTDGLIENRTEPLDAGLSRLRRAATALRDERTPHAFIDGLLDRIPASIEDDTALLALYLP